MHNRTADLGENSSRMTCQAQQDIELLLGKCKILAFKKRLSGHGVDDQIVPAYKRIAQFLGWMNAFTQPHQGVRLC